jgi:hypothetical protein
MRKKQKMLKSKNEATMLLKTKDRPWVRFQNEPILEVIEPVIRRQNAGRGIAWRG